MKTILKYHLKTKILPILATFLAYKSSIAQISNVGLSNSIAIKGFMINDTNHKSSNFVLFYDHQTEDFMFSNDNAFSFIIRQKNKTRHCINVGSQTPKYYCDSILSIDDKSQQLAQELIQEHSNESIKGFNQQFNEMKKIITDKELKALLLIEPIRAIFNHDPHDIVEKKHIRQIYLRNKILDFKAIIETRKSDTLDVLKDIKLISNKPGDDSYVIVLEQYIKDPDIDLNQFKSISQDEFLKESGLKEAMKEYNLE